MKTNWQDPQTSEIRSTHIAGLMDAVGKIEDVLDLKLQAETAVPLTEVYISELDRYRIYQAPAGKRNWASSPAPVIKKNGVVVSSGFTIDYGGGAIIVSPSATSTDTFTADVSYTKTGDNALDAHKAENTIQVKRVFRDLQIEGVQTLSFEREVKGLYFFANINNTTRITFGSVDKYGNICSFTQSLSDGRFYGFNNHPFIIYSDTNKATRFVVDFRGNEIDLIWSLAGDGTGAEGDVGLNIIAFF